MSGAWMKKKMIACYSNFCFNKRIQNSKSQLHYYYQSRKKTHLNFTFSEMRILQSTFFFFFLSRNCRAKYVMQSQISKDRQKKPKGILIFKARHTYQGSCVIVASPAFFVTVKEKTLTQNMTMVKGRRRRRIERKTFFSV